ncbi:MAG: hypothetical protein ACI9LM_001816 [Alteromonadaceae bacterium]|jgi:hypothetical protein
MLPLSTIMRIIYVTIFDIGYAQTIMLKKNTFLIEIKQLYFKR